MSSMTTAEVAAAIGVTVSTLAKMIGDGRVPPPDQPSSRVGVPNSWSAAQIKPYLPGGPKAAAKLKPGRKKA